MPIFRDQVIRFRTPALMDLNHPHIIIHAGRACSPRIFR
jgi:hypothetical protein